MSSGRSDARRAASAQQRAVDAISGVNVPTIDEQKLFLEMLQQQGSYTPEMEAYLGELASEAENVDPRLRSTQLESMDALRAIAEQGGYTDADQAAMRLYQRDASAYDQAKQNQILQQMEQQGMGSSGNRLVAQLMSAQSAADRLARSGDEQLANALNRELSATTQAAGLAGAITDQDLARARQLDSISQFNQQNQQSLNQRNVGSRNQAQQMNLAEQQRVADSNVGLRNQQQQYNTGLAQQQFQNQMQHKQALSNAYTGQANAYKEAAANAGSGMAQIGSVAGGIVGAVYGGPAGAAAGSQVGGSLGSAVGK